MISRTANGVAGSGAIPGSSPMWPASPVVARDVDDAVSPAEVAVATGIARAEADGSVVFAAPPGSPSLARADSDGNDNPSAGGGVTATGTVQAGDPASGGDAGAPDLAAMTDLLYERIEYRLRTDLLLERERLGSLPDF